MVAGAALAADEEVVDAAALDSAEGQGVGGVVDGGEEAVGQRGEGVDADGDGVDVDLPFGGVALGRPGEGGVLDVVEVMSDEVVDRVAVGEHLDVDVVDECPFAPATVLCEGHTGGIAGDVVVGEVDGLADRLVAREVGVLQGVEPGYQGAAGVGHTDEDAVVFGDGADLGVELNLQLGDFAVQLGQHGIVGGACQIGGIGICATEEAAAVPVGDAVGVGRPQQGGMTSLG